jgi:hypothetical protein
LKTEFESYLRRLTERQIRGTHHALIASLCEQKLGLFTGQKLSFTCDISYAAKGRSCVENSLGTPWGLHCVAEKHGHGAPKGMVFIGRQATGQCWFEREDHGLGQKPLVTTRILRLKGLEPGINSGKGIDSFERYIYIHGTNLVDKFPQNVSAGCILVQDDDLLQLFDAVPAGCHVWLSEPK